jgi:hypothetical protein
MAMTYSLSVIRLTGKAIHPFAFCVGIYPTRNFIHLDAGRVRSWQRFDHTKASAGLGKSGCAAATLACAGKAQAKQLLWVWPLQSRAGKYLLAFVAQAIQDEQLGRNALPQRFAQAAWPPHNR